jgi:hypothetical protein
VPIVEGENLEVNPPHRLVQSFRALWSDAVKAEGTSRVTWEIRQVADSCCLTVVHDQMREGANIAIYGGWPQVLSGLKTWLETGETLATPGASPTPVSGNECSRPLATKPHAPPRCRRAMATRASLLPRRSSPGLLQNGLDFVLIDSVVPDVWLLGLGIDKEP